LTWPVAWQLASVATLMAILAGGAWTAWRMTHPKNNNNHDPRPDPDRP